MYSSDELRAMLAAAEIAERDALAAATVTATDAVTATAAAAIRDAVSLMLGADAAGLPIDHAAILAAAIERATPAAPAVLAAVVAPDPAPVLVTPTSAAGAARRRRNRVERDWSGVASGSIWAATLAGNDGRVKVVVDPDGRGATFIATTGNRGTFRNPSRATQSACGDPRGAGRKDEATVNGFKALILVRDAAGTAVVDGPTLDAVTAV
jgi:CBS domain-containing protein